ncbi:hypothetical protein H6P81_011387 [Aristolochia fimbriata]|uniref:Uncharacterized protein n=1 Tax=Aristolochia fimbriata TaxID=158543 RepID=A0AAV7EUV6_ARIFI|nr:hypothetical protein H6P81_011387 [Aristolochia fimbriata]
MFSNQPEFMVGYYFGGKKTASSHRLPRRVRGAADEDDPGKMFSDAAFPVEIFFLGPSPQKNTKRKMKRMALSHGFLSMLKKLGRSTQCWICSPFDSKFQTISEDHGT